MDIKASLSSAAIQARREHENSPLAKAMEESIEFQDVLKKFDEAMRATQRSKDEKRKEAADEARKKAREKKINELRAIIDSLKSKLSSSGHDPAVAAELSTYQTQLLWLLAEI